MSYILEALKKSQQERELGKVPTLETEPSMATGHRPGINYWGIAAVSLAGLALVIALYAAITGVPGIPGTEPGPATIEPLAPASPSVPSEQGAAEQKEKVEEPSSSEENVRTMPPPAAETGPQREPVLPGTTVSGTLEPIPEPAPAVAEPPRPPPTPPEKVRREEDKVPEDLRQDIEEFKKQLRREKSGKSKPTGTEVLPSKARLPKEVQTRLPAYLMTLHLYDPDPAKRFVLINARKLREGERTRQDILVEEIRSDGVVLSYEGQRFFQHR